MYNDGLEIVSDVATLTPACKQMIIQSPKLLVNLLAAVCFQQRL